MTPVHLRRALAVIASFAAAAGAAAPRPATEEPVAARNGMVVTAQHLATDVGVEVLRHGGNAVDAAVAVGYTLAVVYPAAGNVGGGGFMTLQMADGRKSFIDFRETAPLHAKADMYVGPEGKLIPGLSTDGYLAAGVPGTVAGLELALQRYGTVPRATLIGPAIALARRGFVLDEGDVRMLRNATEDFRRDGPAAAIFLVNGQAHVAGDRLVQPDLARTLQAIAGDGAAGFYRGRVAQAIVAASRAGGGIFSMEDFERYRARERAPVECDYRGYHVVSAPPPSSGGVVLCEMLGVLEGYPLKELGFHSAQAVHYEIEAMRHAYADRNGLLGDPDFVDNPTARLLDPAYARALRASIDPTRAGVSAEIRAGSELPEGTHTTHYSVVDRFGNAVAVTYTLNEWFGARVVATGTGVLINDEMDDFTAKLGAANSYELVQGERNAIAPGKRPLSSMTPTIVTQGGKPLLVLGTPGGSRIITTVLQVILNVLDYGMNLQQAVDAPRFHEQWLPDHTYAEPGALSPDAQRALVAMGHTIVPERPSNHVCAIMVGAPGIGLAPVDDDRYYGANDWRHGTGSAAGY